MIKILLNIKSIRIYVSLVFIFQSIFYNNMSNHYINNSNNMKNLKKVINN